MYIFYLSGVAYSSDKFEDAIEESFIKQFGNDTNLMSFLTESFSAFKSTVSVRIDEVKNICNEERMADIMAG